MVLIILNDKDWRKIAILESELIIILLVSNSGLSKNFSIAGLKNWENGNKH